MLVRVLEALLAPYESLKRVSFDCFRGKKNLGSKNFQLKNIYKSKSRTWIQGSKPDPKLDMNALCQKYPDGLIWIFLTE